MRLESVSVFLILAQPCLQSSKKSDIVNQPASRRIGALNYWESILMDSLDLQGDFNAEEISIHK